MMWLLIYFVVICGIAESAMPRGSCPKWLNVPMSFVLGWVTIPVRVLINLGRGA